MSPRTALVIAFVVALTLAGCQGRQPLPDERALATPAPTATLQPSPSPTATPQLPTSPTMIPQPSASPTALPPTPTATSVLPTTGLPTATKTPTPVPATVATATQTATATTAAIPPAPTRTIPPQQQIRLPVGFGISIYASGLQGPRMMALGPDGMLYVAERGRDRVVRLPDDDRDGVADTIEAVSTGLNAPSSIAFHMDGSLYVGETTRVLRLSSPDGDGIFRRAEVIVAGLPGGQGHSTRTVLFGPDGRSLFVSIGSSCNVCLEQDPRRATIARYDPDGSSETIYATGLRNAVGMTFRPGTNELWATNNGRDRLGDDQPPETIYMVEQGDDAGWPRCHAGRIVDPDYGQPGNCEGIAAPIVEMQAHSAPLGLTFYTGQQFPEAYRGDLFVAFHGSWNRTEPTGYKIVHIPIAEGTPGPVQDFAVGWLREDGSNWGRPVDVITGPDGSLLMSDDGGGHIYRIFFTGE